jgi:hypothetical protein
LEKTITAYARRTPAAFLEIILLNLEKKSMRRGEFPYRREMSGEGSLVIEVGLWRARRGRKLFQVFAS